MKTRILFLISVLVWASVSFLPSCKDVGVPPDRIIVDTTSHGPDTTSHDFVWTIDTLGDATGTLYDVAIINDTLAYAVGEIWLTDSTGTLDPKIYNVAIWNGIVWSVKRVMVEFRGSIITPPLEDVFAFSSNQIWLVGSLPIHGDGTNWTMYDLRTTLDPGISLSRVWGLNDNEMYFVGRQGSIAHFKGSTWTKIESGTTLDFQDIHGELFNGQSQILTVASDPFHSFDRYIAAINSGTVTVLSDSGISEPLSGIWFRSGEKYYTVGSGIYRKQSLTDDRWNGMPLELTPYYSNTIRGSDTNNVIVVGAFADVLHYNGSTWKSYPELLKGNASLYGLAVKGKLVMAVGFWGEKALIVRGTQE